MWALKILVSWWLKGQTKTIADVGGLLGSRFRVIPDRWDVPHYRGGGHILHYWASRRGEVVNLCSRGGLGASLTVNEYIVVYCYLDT